MSADDKIHALFFHKPVGKRALRFHRQQLVLNAPVKIHTHHFSPAGASLVDVGTDAVAVDVVNHHRALHRNSVGAVGVTEHGNFQSFHIDDEGRHLAAVLTGEKRACVGNLQRIEHRDCASQSGIATVETVVVGGEQQVEARG